MARHSSSKATAGAAVARDVAHGAPGARPARPEQAKSASPAITASYTHAAHRRRLENIAFARRQVSTCMRKHLVSNYLFAQCCYNLGEYPHREPWSVGRYDEEELDRLRDHGIQLIQLFDEWADHWRLFGGDKFTPGRPAEVQRFIELAHQRGIRVLPYASSCFFERANPDFQQAWSREGDDLVGGIWNMARCSPASPGWRAYLLPRLVRILDEFGADGIYIDGGYVCNAHKRLRTPAADEVVAFEETAEVDGAFADLLALIYSEVKRRGGVLKLHVNGAEQPMAGGLKVYDYLWVGEGVGNAEQMRDTVKNYEPYVVPCIDAGHSKGDDREDAYLHGIPYMQFPLLQAGKPFTGERALHPGVRGRENDRWVQRCGQIWKHYQAHPDGPYTYGVWDDVPGRPETRATHARWLRQYRPLVEEGTWAWLEIGESALFPKTLPQGVVASLFANRELYLVLANYSRQPVELETADAYVAMADAAAAPSNRWTLGQRSLAILRKV